MSDKLTYPHEYAPLLNGAVGVRPVVVGGQAVNLWALTYIRGADNYSFGSLDMDVLATPQVINWMASVSGWDVSVCDDTNAVRRAQLTTKTVSGKELHVEALNFVLGLDDADLAAFVDLQHGGQVFRVLDPVALLKAKCANMNELRQGGLERHDAGHLDVLAKCVPEYLRDIAGDAAGGKLSVDRVTGALGRLFNTMKTPAFGGVLWHADVVPDKLVPVECRKSPLAPIRELCETEFPEACATFWADNYNPAYKPEQSHGPSPPAVGGARRRKPRTMRRY